MIDQLIDWRKGTAHFTGSVDLGYVGFEFALAILAWLYLRSPFIVTIIVTRSACVRACARACVYAFNSRIGTERDRRTRSRKDRVFPIRCVRHGRVSRAVFSFPSRAPVIPHGVIAYRVRDKKNI